MHSGTKKTIKNRIDDDCFNRRTDKFRKEFIDSFFETISNLAYEQHVVITKLGRFESRVKADRTARNPKTLEPARTGERKVLSFCVSSRYPYKESLNET